MTMAKNATSRVHAKGTQKVADSRPHKQEEQHLWPQVLHHLHCEVSGGTPGGEGISPLASPGLTGIFAFFILAGKAIQLVEVTFT